MGNNSLLISDTIDSERDYGVVMVEVNNPDTKDVANVASQEWYGTNGEDVYIPPQFVFKPYDVVVTMGVLDGTKNAETRKEEFLNAVRNLSQPLASIKNDYNKINTNQCYISKVENDQVGENFLIFKVTFRVIEP